MNGPAKNKLLRYGAIALGFCSLGVDATDAPNPYVLTKMDVLNFIIDGPALAKNNARIEVTGSYLHVGNVDALFADQLAAARERSTPDPQPHLIVLSENATRELRALLVNCQANPVTSQLGCRLTIRGWATFCSITSSFGAERSEPCLDAESGFASQ